MDSPINWVGGKSQSAKKIASMMPQHRCYVEVFGGGLWVFFAKERSKVEVINDINSELINFYRVIQRDCDSFVKRGKYELFSRELYHEYLRDYMSGYHFELDNVERAFRFFVLIKQSYSAKFGGGWRYGSTMNEAVSFFNEIKEMDKISERLQMCQIDNRDFESVIKGYDNKHTLFFLDPPYVRAPVDDYYFKSVDKQFTLYDHQRLYVTLKDIKGKFILTYDDDKWVRDRYSEYYIYKNKIYYCSADKNNRRHVVELIITNYDVDKIDKFAGLKQSKLV